MTGVVLDLAKYFRLDFGTYKEVNKDTNPSNGDNELNDPSICLVPTENTQGIYKFLDLKKRMRVNG